MDDNKKFHFSISDTENPVEIREGKAMEQLPPKSEDVSGTIQTPRLYLDKRPMVNLEESHLMVDRQSASMILRTDIKNPFGSNKAEGCIRMDENLEGFKINTGNEWSHKALAMLIRMNRNMFENRQEATKLANLFRDLEVKAETELKNMDDERGSFEVKRSRAIQSINVPESFAMKTKIHVGGEKHAFNVDVVINPGDYSIQLVSNELKEAAETEAEDLIETELEGILRDYPSLLIYEQ